MKALLLAAGLGTRLGRFTEKKPKCLVQVGEETMLDHWLFKLDRIGVEQFFINTHYLADQVATFVSRHQLSEKITLLHEPKLLGTGKTILHNLQILGGDLCFIAHVDNYCTDPLDEFLLAHRHRPNDTILSMLTFITKTPEQCGVVEVDECDRLVRFYEKQPISPSLRANGAVYIASNSFFDVMRTLDPEPSDISCDIIPALMNKIYCFHTEYYFEDIGTTAALIRANGRTADNDLLDHKSRG